MSVRLFEWLFAAVISVRIASSVARAKGLCGERGPRRSILGTIAIAALSLCGLVGSASAQATADEEGRTHETKLEKWRDYYRAHVRIRLGRERRLSNGVAWRLFFDTSTKLAMPRITWMPDASAMRKANRLFDAFQGAQALGYASYAAEWREVYEEAAREGEKDGSGVSLMIPRDNFITQPRVALTYASSRLVSYFEVEHLATEGMSKVLTPWGWILDLEQRRRYSIEACDVDKVSPELSALEEEVTFQLGDWLEVCDPRSVAKFLALFETNLEVATKSPAFRRDPNAEYCKESLRPPSHRGWDFALYLTTRGLAVHTSGFDSHMGRNCLRHESAVIPVIIPYRDLEPFMKPGPWRDELLK